MKKNGHPTPTTQGVFETPAPNFQPPIISKTGAIWSPKVNVKVKVSDPLKTCIQLESAGPKEDM